MRVFISYNRLDVGFAKRLRDILQEWGYSPWLDVDDIPIGVAWDTAIDEALKASAVVIGLITPESVRSINVLDEWNDALTTNKRLLPVMVRKVSETDIPVRYRRLQRIDLTDDEKGGLAYLKKALTALYDEQRTSTSPTISGSSPSHEPAQLTTVVDRLDKPNETQRDTLRQLFLRGFTSAEQLLLAMRDQFDLPLDEALDLFTHADWIENPIQELLIQLTSYHADVREYAARLLGEMRHPDAILGMRETLKDRSWFASKAAAEALENIGTRQAIDAAEQWRRKE